MELLFSKKKNLRFFGPNVAGIWELRIYNNKIKILGVAPNLGTLNFQFKKILEIFWHRRGPELGNFEFQIKKFKILDVAGNSETFNCKFKKIFGDLLGPTWLGNLGMFVI